MSLDRALAAGRAAAEARMTDRFTVLRPTGEVTQDPETLRETPVLATFLADVKGRFQTSEGQTRETQTPGVKVAESSLAWHCPISVEGVLTDDIVECTSSVDPELVGVRVRITAPFTKSQATARRFPVERVS